MSLELLNKIIHKYAWDSVYLKGIFRFFHTVWLIFHLGLVWHITNIMAFSVFLSIPS